MPLDPHTWNDVTDFWTATLANGDLYRYDGQEFVPTGIQFHARRPVYKAFNPLSGASCASGAYVPVFNTSAGTQLSVAVADTGSLFAAYMDPFNSGHFDLLIDGGGGLPTSRGGLGLAIGYPSWPSINSGSVGAGFGPWTSATPTIDGMYQNANGNVYNQPFVIDLLDLGVSTRWTTFGYQNSGSSLSGNGPIAIDGSGLAVRQHAHWVSVYPSNGFTAAQVPNPVPSWTPLSTLSASLLNGNTGIRDVLRFLNMPPLMRAAQAFSQSLTANTVNTLTSMVAQYDSYKRFTPNTYTVPMTGLYFVHGIVTCQNFSGELSAGVKINSTNYYGPRAVMPSSGYGSASKTQIFSLNAGDTISLVANPSAAATTSSNHPSRLIVLHVSCAGVPSVLPIPPDTTYRWEAGTPGDLSQQFNNHIANDLIFLTQRPYVMAYQTVAQSGIGQNAVAALSLDTVAGIVHGDNGDNYDGWNGTSYTAQVAGWYMAVQESFLAQPGLTTNPWVSAAFTPNPAGDHGWDEYQKWCMSTSSSKSPGATAVSYYYLRPGDTLTPGLITGASSNGTLSTAASAGTQSHFEIVWLGE